VVFAVFCVRDFLRFSQNSTKQTKKYTKRTKYALCNTAQYGAVHLSLTQKMSTKNIRKTRPKHCKTSAKHRKTLFFKKHSQNTTKHPQNTRKTPQNTAKHHKTHLLTKQTKLANKPLRSLRTGGWAAGRTRVARVRVVRNGGVALAVLLVHLLVLAPLARGGVVRARVGVVALALAVLLGRLFALALPARVGAIALLSRRVRLLCRRLLLLLLLFLRRRLLGRGSAGARWLGVNLALPARVGAIALLSLSRPACDFFAAASFFSFFFSFGGAFSAAGAPAPGDAAAPGRFLVRGTAPAAGAGVDFAADFLLRSRAERRCAGSPSPLSLASSSSSAEETTSAGAVFLFVAASAFSALRRAEGR